MNRIVTYFRASFRNKILGLTSLVFVSFLLVLFISSQKILTTALSKQFYTQTNSLGDSIQNRIKPYILSENVTAIENISQSLIARDNVAFIRIYSYDKILYENGVKNYPSQRQFGLDESLMTAADDYYDVQYIFEIENTIVGRVEVSFSIKSERQLLYESNRKLAIFATLTTIIGLLLMSLLANKMTAKINLLQQASNRIADGEDEVELPLDGEDEIAKTGWAFKNMLLQIKEKYEAINLSPDGIVLISSNSIITYINPALEVILGSKAKTLRGKSLADFEGLLISLLDRRAHTDIQSLDKLVALSEFRIHMPDFKVLRCIRKRVDTTDGQAYSEVFYLRDITHESEVDRMKSEFLTTAAHELRTPLASVMGFSELLMINEYPADRIKYVAETINRQSQNLKSLVDDLLDIARIEARSNGVLQLATNNLKELVTECCQFIMQSNHKCQLIFDANECVWPLLSFDENKIKQGLMNILTNAYKYSHQAGIVTVDTVILDNPREDTVWFGIRVTDHGIGMTQEQLSHVGEKFYRADNTGTIPGTGLGVALTSEIISLHNGHLDISSQLGQGTQVTLWIPVCEACTENDSNDT